MFYMSKFYPVIRRADKESLCKITAFFVQEAAHNMGQCLESRYPERAQNLHELLSGPSGFCKEKAQLYCGVKQVLIDLDYNDLLTQPCTMRFPDSDTQLIDRFTRVAQAASQLRQHLTKHPKTTPGNVNGRIRHNKKSEMFVTMVLREYITLTVRARDLRGGDLRVFGEQHTDVMLHIVQHIVDNEGNDKAQQEGLERWRQKLEEY